MKRVTVDYMVKTTMTREQFTAQHINACTNGDGTGHVILDRGRETILYSHVFRIHFEDIADDN